MKEVVEFQLNGRATTLTLDADRLLLWVLRTDLALTGAKYGCGAGLCGACTVLVDGEAVRSCMFPVREVQGKEVTTVEGLASDAVLHPVQQAFVEHDAMQCGFCTSGMILSAYSLLRRNSNPSGDQIIAHMEGNLCRCGSHKRVLEAIQTASRKMNGGRP
ncbi:MAG: (2Fe-2S)-binding protein [Gemmatimonadota bacterium]|nr:MAG: (2Fe-2S)-binding protein [Gemmatimonadota bacterium]